MHTTTAKNYNLEETQERIKVFIEEHTPRFNKKPVYFFEDLQQLIKNIIKSGKLNCRDVLNLTEEYPSIHEKVFWKLSKKYWHECAIDNRVPTKGDVVVDTFAVLRELHNIALPEDAGKEGLMILLDE